LYCDILWKVQKGLQSFFDEYRKSHLKKDMCTKLTIRHRITAYKYKGQGGIDEIYGSESLEVKHCVLQVPAIDSSTPGFYCVLPHIFFRGVLWPDALQESVQVASASFACKVGVVRWRDEADGFGSTSKHVADGVGKHLEFVGLEPYFIVDNVVMGRTGRALKATMGYQRK